MKESSELIQFFGKPTHIQFSEGYPKKKEYFWNMYNLDKKRPLFYSIYYKDDVIYASVVVNQEALKYPLIYNVSYSAIKQLLVIRSETLHEILFSLSLALGLELDYELLNEEIYNLLFEKIKINMKI